ncbi:MAG: lauroyl acyltransferase [Desulfobacteraceae bacterium]|nr:MAG: lauroyl acyltransferase [Desulfobacteraceae bacterium]
MVNLFYRFLMLVSRVFGIWVFILIARIIATGYFFLFPSRRAVSISFYRELFPEKSRWYHTACAWKQYHRFTYSFLDRFLLHHFNSITHTAEGREHLDHVSEKGGILVMSHLGNWEIAAHFLKQEGYPVLLFMGRKHKEQLEGMQKESMIQGGVKIIAVGPEDSSPFILLDSIQQLKSGGIVSLTGDRIWSENQRTVTVRFLGHEVALPEAPYILALLTQAPLYTFFAFRTGQNHYDLKISPPVYLPKTSRKERSETIQQAAQSYADTLEKMVREHPFDWYHFESFLKTD